MKSRRAIDQLLYVKYGDKWDSLDVALRESVLLETEKFLRKPSSQLARRLKRAADIDFNLAFVVLGLMLGCFGGLVSNVVHDSAKQYGNIGMIVELVGSFVAVVGMLWWLKKAVVDFLGDEDGVDAVYEVAERYL